MRETPSTGSRALAEGLAAGLALGMADLLASAPWRLPASLWMASLGLGAALGLGSGALAALARRRELAAGAVIALGLGLEAAATASRELQDAPRVAALALVAVAVLATLVVGPSVLAGCCWSVRVLVPVLVPAASLLAPLLGAPAPVAVACVAVLPLALLAGRRRSPRPWPFLVLGALLPLPGWLLASPPPRLEREPARAAGPGPRRPDVVLVVVDTLRADAPAPDGTLAALASEGVSFSQCISAAPWTLPSVASILTGLLPSQHGAVSATTPLAGEVTTLAERLAAAGYATGAFTGGAFVGVAHGLDQGFEVFDAGRERRFRASHVHVPLVWRLARNRYAPLLPLVRLVDERVGIRGVLAEALDFARARADRSRFLLVHSYEVHDYYLFDPDTDGDPRAGLSARFAGRLTVPPAELVHAPQADLDAFRERYQGRVRSVEACLAEMRTTLGSLLGPDAIWIVTSDHGEGFDAARGRVHHGGRLHDDLLHVPLVVRAPGRLPEGRVVDAPVRSVDLLPTLLDLLELPAPEETAGESLLPALRGEQPYPPLAYAEEFEHDLGLRAARSALWKLVRDPAGQTLFDLSRTPEEAAPSRAAPPDLLRALDTFEERYPPRARAVGELDRATLDHLRELGYVE